MHEAHRKLDELLELVRHLHRKIDAMSVDLSQLEAAVAADTDAVSSAVKLINGIAAELAAAKTDPAAVQALVDKLNAQSAALSAAVVANTAPAAPPAPTP